MGNSWLSTMTSIKVPQPIRQAIQSGAARTGSDFSDLLHEAAIESGFHTSAKAKTSSATGLFQFTGQTWLHMIKAHGAEYGLGNYADHIQVDSSGKAHVSDAVWRVRILDMRQDPQISTEMTCELDSENRRKLRQNVGGTIGPAELYLAHFLGAGGASSLLNAMRANPNTKAADILPNAAAANLSIFYSGDGQSRSVAQVYGHFAQKLDRSVPNIVAKESHTSTDSSFPPILVNPAAASLFATMILEQMDMTTTLKSALDVAEAESAISILV